MTQPTVTAAQYIDPSHYIDGIMIEMIPDGAADAAELIAINDAAVEILEPVTGWDEWDHVVSISDTYAGHTETRYALATIGA